MKFLSITALAALFYSTESLKMLRQEHELSATPVTYETAALTTTDPITDTVPPVAT